MNKLDLIQALKDSNQLSKSEAETVINLFFDKVAEALAQGARVEIRGLCSFFVKEYKAYTGRNPKTGEKVKIARKKLPFFKAGKGLKERVDGWSQERFGFIDLKKAYEILDWTDGVTVIQGDHRDTVKGFLEGRGFRVKIDGGG